MRKLYNSGYKDPKMTNKIINRIVQIKNIILNSHHLRKKIIIYNLFFQKKISQIKKERK